VKIGPLPLSSSWIARYIADARRISRILGPAGPPSITFRAVRVAAS